MLLLRLLHNDFYKTLYWRFLQNPILVLSDLNEVEKFAIEATEVLRKQPQTVEEIGESNKRHKEYKEQMDLKRGLMDMSEQKNKVLTLWTKEQVKDFS